MKFENEIKFNSKNKADIQAYLDYINIVGTDDNGKLMSEKEFENYKKNLKNKKREHFYVYWINSGGFECKTIGPESMCFCNHRYKYHDYNNVNNIKKIKCKNAPANVMNMCLVMGQMMLNVYVTIPTEIMIYFLVHVKKGIVNVKNLILNLPVIVEKGTIPIKQVYILGMKE